MSLSVEGIAKLTGIHTVIIGEALCITNPAAESLVTEDLSLDQCWEIYLSAPAGSDLERLAAHKITTFYADLIIKSEDVSSLLDLLSYVPVDVDNFTISVLRRAIDVTRTADECCQIIMAIPDTERGREFRSFCIRILEKM